MLERLNRMTVRARLRGLAGLLAVVVAVVALLTTFTVSRLVGTVDRFAGASIPALRALAELDESVAMATAEVRGLSVPWLADRRDAVAAALTARLSAVRAAGARFDGLDLPEERAEEWKALKPKLDAWLGAVEAVTPLLVAAASGQEDGALAQMRRTAGVAQMNITHKPVAEGMAALSGAVAKDVDAEAEAARSRGARSVALLLAISLLGGGFTVVVLLLVSRGIARALAALVAEAGRVSDAVRAGRLDVRGDPGATTPEFRPILDGLNDTAEAFARPVRMAAEHIDRISRGDVPAPITEAYQGDFNAMKDSLNRAIAAVEALVADAAMLAEAGMAGRLSTRADAARHQGDFRRVIQGVNDTLDAFGRPVAQAARCIESLSRGEVPARLAMGVQGDLARLEDHLNACLDAVARLVEDADALATAGVEGRLSHRADAGRHLGDFRRIVEGVNRSLDAVVGPLQAAARNLDALSRGEVPPRITEAFPGDYAIVKTSVNGCADAVDRLVADSRGLAEAAVAGRLGERAEVARHQGDFRKVVEGVNRTLDAVVAPVGEATRALEALAKRDLRVRVAGTYSGDHARLQSAVNSTAEALHAALVQVAATAEQVSSASGQIAATSQSVASGASQQAASLHETGDGLARVSELVQRVAEHATRANALAAQASRAASAGTESVGEMQGAMTKIRASAEGTSQIIKDINDIAFQTNLLALNAAVEAARAGEAGRGFAVVAEEVRSLALRAKEAATKTEGLIKESVRQAGEGEGTARQVAGKLGEIAKGIGEVTAIVSEIAAAAREETTGVAQVSSAVGEMDKVTQLNAASAEESSSAAAELSSQAEELAAMVGTFNLDRGGAARGGRAGGRPGAYELGRAGAAAPARIGS